MSRINSRSESTLPVQISALTPILTPARIALPEETPVPPSAATLPAPPSSSQHPKKSYKSLLQEVFQRSNLPLPVYKTVNEGLQHAPKFRSTVCVNGVDITSDRTFWTRKEAENFVAELGFKSISDKIVEEVPQKDFPLLQEEKIICKSILHELAAKMRLETPSYNTTQCEGELPIFVSSLVFNGLPYNGGPCKSKKEAEQLAALAVLTSLLDDPIFGEVLRDSINAKRKVFGTLPNANNRSAFTPDTGTEASTLSNNAPVAIGNLPEVADHNVSATAGDLVGKVPPPSHGIKFAKPESPLRATILSGPASSSSQQQLPIEFVPPQSSSPAEANPLPSKKRRKNKKKSNKRLCLGGAELAVNNTIAFSQAPTSSVPLTM